MIKAARDLRKWLLACDVNGATVTTPGTYTVTSTAQPPFTVIDLQSAVGSPDPNQCSVEGLTVHTLLPLVVVDIDEALPSDRRRCGGDHRRAGRDPSGRRHHERGRARGALRR